MFINIRQNCTFQENSKTLKFLTQKETMVMQISAESPSPNFHSFTFLVICANFSCKIEKFELEFVYFRDIALLSGQPLIYLKEKLQLKD